MIDQSAALAAIERVWNIEWRHDPARIGSHVALMREYLRRSALVAEALGLTADWPWYDAAARLSLSGVDRSLLPGYVFLDPEPQYRGRGTDPLEDRVIALQQHVQQSKLANTWMKPTYLWYIRWASVRGHPALAPLGLPDLYDPLIVLYERGGWFKPEQGYLDLGEANVTVAGWRVAARLPALFPLDAQVDAQALDRIDRAQTERRTP